MGHRIKYGAPHIRQSIGQDLRTIHTPIDRQCTVREPLSLSQSLVFFIANLLYNSPTHPTAIAAFQALAGLQGCRPLIRCCPKVCPSLPFYRRIYPAARPSPRLWLVGGPCFCLRSKSLKVKATGPSHCDFSSLNSPLALRSPVGNFLGGMSQNHRQLLHITRMLLNQDLNEDKGGGWGSGSRERWWLNGW